MSKKIKVIYQGPSAYFPDLDKIVETGDEILVTSQEAADHPDRYQKAGKKAAGTNTTKDKE